MSRGPDGNSAHISQDFHLLELAPSPRGGVAGVSSGQSLHPSGCGSYVAAEYTEPATAPAGFGAKAPSPTDPARHVAGVRDDAGTLRYGVTMDERPSEMVTDAEPPEAEAAPGRPRRSARHAAA